MSRYICILDFEATCWRDEKANGRAEIIEFPSVLIEVTWQNKVNYVSEFKSYVRPTQFPILTDFCTELTGITQNDVSNADTFESVFKKHNEWLIENVPDTNKFYFVTCGHWDLRNMLPEQVKKLTNLTTMKTMKIPQKYKCYSNLKDEFSSFYSKKSGGMTNMLDCLNLELEGRHHSGIDDCRNTTRILVQMIKDGYDVKKTVLNKLN